ncbi:MAG: putative phosphatase [Phycisphaerales bacterium]|nr:putative phosphatase [Phycisphaerales bacterium]
MRLVRDDDTAPLAPNVDSSDLSLPPLALPPHPLPPAAIPVLEHLGDLQDQIQGLHAELNMLRRRDETLRFFMHRLDEELRLAARIQQDFLPKILPQVGRVHFHTLFRPAGYVSGDLYDVMRLDERHVGFFICDAVGHGMPAALLTMFIKRALVTKEVFESGYRLLGPGEALNRLNQALVDQNLSQATYATAMYGIVNTETHEVRFAKGGHPSPALLYGDGRLEFPDATGALLGIFPDEQFAVTTLQLAPGDRLFVYSDGIEVAFCGEDLNNCQQWQDELHRRRELGTEALLLDLSAELDRQAGSLQPKDDLTVIALEIK